MLIELYHFKLTTLRKTDKWIQTINGSIRAHSRNNALHKLEQKMPNLTNGMFEVIAFTARPLP